MSLDSITDEMKNLRVSGLERCDGVNRRAFLHLGVLSAFGLSLSDAFRLRSQANPTTRKASSCILIWLDGGPSHLDMFDMKPDAPREIRSPFSSISTKVPGVRICEHLPRIAGVMDKVSLIRSLTHELGNHDTGARFLLTGHRPNPSIEHPSLGSWIARGAGTERAMPPYVAIPSDAVGGLSGAAKPGFLPSGWSAFNTGQDPGRITDLHPPVGITLKRGERRMEMLQKMDSFNRSLEQSTARFGRDAFYDQAARLLASKDARAAFDLDAEKPQTVQRYGQSRIGKGCLLARRLVEAGSRFVTVVDVGWDTHQNIARELPDSRFPGSGKLPALDRACAGLITDLAERGLLESTLVVLMGEFGRTPKLNALGGRDHWPRAGTVLLAGGGVQGGRVIGATNSFGETPVERPVSPEDLSCTLLTLLGISPQEEVITPSGRPVKIQAVGNFISELT